MQYKKFWYLIILFVLTMMSLGLEVISDNFTLRVLVVIKSLLGLSLLLLLWSVISLTYKTSIKQGHKDFSLNFIFNTLLFATSLFITPAIVEFLILLGAIRSDIITSEFFAIVGINLSEISSFLMYLGFIVAGLMVVYSLGEEDIKSVKK